MKQYGTLSVFLGWEEVKLLKEYSKKYQLPMSRLIAMAVDNEFDQETPFHYPCVLPVTQFIEGAYVEEAQKIMKYLEKFPSGISRDQLMLNRRSVGIISRENLLLGFRELLENGIIIEVRPKERAAKYKWKYPENYKVIKIADVAKVNAVKNKKAEIERLKRELEEMEKS